MIDTYCYFIIPMHRGSYSFIRYLIAYVIFFYQFNYGHLMSSETG